MSLSEVLESKPPTRHTLLVAIFPLRRVRRRGLCHTLTTADARSSPGGELGAARASTAEFSSGGASRATCRPPSSAETFRQIFRRARHHLLRHGGRQAQFAAR